MKSELHTSEKEMIMQKFTFTVDIVTDSPVTIDTQTVRSMLLSSVDGIGMYSAVKVHESETLSDQGLKVWAKRCAGISLVVPKPPKAPKAPKAVEAPKVVKSELVAAIEG